MQGDPEGAIAKFRQLYAQETPVPECVTGWARALVDLGRNEEALAKFAEAEKIDKENARNYLHWGEALQTDRPHGRRRRADREGAQARGEAATTAVTPSPAVSREGAAAAESQALASVSSASRSTMWMRSRARSTHPRSSKARKSRLTISRTLPSSSARA